MIDERPEQQALPALLEALAEMKASLARIEEALTARRARLPRSRGRKPIPDTDALDQVRELMQRGCERWAALRSVAMTMGGNVDAHRQRLSRKLGKEDD